MISSLLHLSPMLCGLIAASLAWGMPTAARAAEAGAIAGIVEGSVTLIRQTTRYAVVEGLALKAEDIVETAPGGFVQIEFDDGAIVGLGEGSRAILQPRVARLKPESLPRLYLLEGWFKVTPAPKGGTPFNLLSTRLEIATLSAAVVALSKPSEYALFVESGTARITEREGTRASLALKASDFVARAAGADKPSVKTTVPGDFLSRMPKFFRDRLPARAAIFAKRNVQPRQPEAVAYADIAHWLRAEAPIRQPLTRQWRSRIADKRFRADIVANLNAHPEWEPIVFPERFVKKDTPASAAGTGSVALPSAAPAN